MRERTRRVVSLARIVVVMTACLTAGCFRHSGDAPDFPALISETTCPDLSGSFALQADAGSQIGWSNTTYTRPLGATATVLSLFDSGGSAMTTVFHRDPAEFAAAVERFRKERPVEYAAWRKQALSLFDLMRGVLKVRRDLPFDTLTQLGPVPEWGMQGRKGECREGWWVEQGDYDTEIAMTRDVRGGLQLRFDKTERKVFSLWAETGAGIPYSIHTQSRWARFAAVDVPAFWTPTVQNLPLDDRVRAVADPDGWLQRDEDPRVTDLRIRARKLMGADAQLLNFKRENDYVLFTGTLPDRSALDALLVALKSQREVAGATLESTMDLSFGRVRFVIHVNLKR
ncbi:MAG: hypothetical protein KA763_11105 [Xanthomonadales bacterium]|nr:hypothetical protein [Xanthomonadales bacterium]